MENNNWQKMRKYLSLSPRSLLRRRRTCVGGLFEGKEKRKTGYWNRQLVQRRESKIGISKIIDKYFASWCYVYGNNICAPFSSRLSVISLPKTSRIFKVKKILMFDIILNNFYAYFMFFREIGPSHPREPSKIIFTNSEMEKIWPSQALSTTAIVLWLYRDQEKLAFLNSVPGSGVFVWQGW